MKCGEKYVKVLELNKNYNNKLIVVQPEWNDILSANNHMRILILTSHFLYMYSFFQAPTHIESKA